MFANDIKSQRRHGVRYLPEKTWPTGLNEQIHKCSTSRPGQGQTSSFGRVCIFNVKFWAAYCGSSIYQLTKHLQALACVWKCFVNWKVDASKEWLFPWIRTLLRSHAWLLKKIIIRNIVSPCLLEFGCFCLFVCLFGNMFIYFVSVHFP